jgi:hypothetical protein
MLIKNILYGLMAILIGLINRLRGLRRFPG